MHTSDNSDKFYIVSEEKNTQVTFTEKTQNKINSVYKEKHGYLIHSWLHEGLEGTVRNRTNHSVSHFKLRLQSLSSLRVYSCITQSLLMHHLEFTHASLRVYLCITQSLLMHHLEFTNASLRVYSCIPKWWIQKLINCLDKGIDSLQQTLIFYPYTFGFQRRKPSKFQTMTFVRSKNISLKYQRFTK